MSTIRQIQANQLNAQQSTGPRSVEGKAVVSMNALQSGLDAKSVIIRGESSADFETLTTQYYDRWLPPLPSSARSSMPSSPASGSTAVTSASKLTFGKVACPPRTGFGPTFFSARP